MFAKHAPGAEPLEVFDAYEGVARQKWVVLAWNSNDIRGLTACTCGKSPPCYVGGCNMCEQCGFRHGRTTVHPGAVRALPLSNTELRTLYKREFSAVEEMVEMADQGRPRKRTKAAAVASGNRVLTGEADAKHEAFKDVDVFTTTLWYHDKIKHNMYDLAHQFANVVKQHLRYMRNTKKSSGGQSKAVFDAAHRRYEVEKLQRFPDLANDPSRIGNVNPKAPWVSPAENQKQIDSLPAMLKQPSNWPQLRKIYKDQGFMKTSETLLLAGDVGAYLLRFSGIEPVYRDLFIENLRLIERY